MYDLLFTNGAAWFTVPALFGTAVFVLRLALMLLGGAHIGGLDFDHGGGHGGGGHGVGHGVGHHLGVGDVGQDSSYAFEILSFQSICAFLMGFGWGGVAALRASNLGVATSIAVGIGCGGVMVWILALMLKGMHELQSSGTITLDAALGVEGDVYVGVPAAGQGRGQVRLVIEQQDRICNAVSQDGELPTRTRVRVVRINDDNTVTVAGV